MITYFMRAILLHCLGLMSSIFGMPVTKKTLITRTPGLGLSHAILLFVKVCCPSFPLMFGISVRF